MFPSAEAATTWGKLKPGIETDDGVLVGACSLTALFVAVPHDVSSAAANVVHAATPMPKLHLRTTITPPQTVVDLRVIAFHRLCRGPQIGLTLGRGSAEALTIRRPDARLHGGYWPELVTDFKCESKNAMIRRRASMADGSWNRVPVSFPATLLSVVDSSAARLLRKECPASA